MKPCLAALGSGGWQLKAWDMVSEIGEKRLARKLLRIVRWSYRISRDLNDRVNAGIGSFVEPAAVSAWKSDFKLLVGGLLPDEKSILRGFYRSSVWFCSVGLLYARWMEEA
jgi:hypothetical protein